MGYELVEMKEKFVKANKRLCGTAFRMYLEGSGRKTKAGIEMVVLARKFIGYSPKTVDVDIFMGLFRTWKGLVQGG